MNYAVIDISDTPYMGTLASYDASRKTARERRGKVKCNKIRKPSWIHNETLEVLRATTKRHRVRSVNRKLTKAQAIDLANKIGMSRSEADAKLRNMIGTIHDPNDVN